MWLDEPLVLASGSETRRALLTSAGLTVIVRPPEPDVEEIAKARFTGPVRLLARTLAQAKAESVAESSTGLVLGADQVLLLDDRIFNKPRDLEEASRTLAALSGRSHSLISAISLWRRSCPVWSFTGEAVLTMRKLSAADIETYLNHVGPAVLTSVGAYQVEGPGIQLFDAIQGDHATILGLPLLPLLGVLRQLQAGDLP